MVEIADDCLVEPGNADWHVCFLVRRASLLATVRAGTGSGNRSLVHRGRDMRLVLATGHGDDGRTGIVPYGVSSSLKVAPNLQVRSGKSGVNRGQCFEQRGSDGNCLDSSIKAPHRNSAVESQRSGANRSEG